MAPILQEDFLGTLPLTRGFKEDDLPEVCMGTHSMPLDKAQCLENCICSHDGDLRRAARLRNKRGEEGARYWKDGLSNNSWLSMIEDGEDCQD